MNQTLTAAPTTKLPLAKIELGPNPRTNMDQGELAELATSIKSVGLIQPVVVRPKGEGWELICGQRRLAAHLLAGLTEIECVVRSYSDADLLNVQVVENIQRADMPPLDEAHAIAAMIERGNSTEEIAGTLGRSLTYILQRNQLNNLSKTLTMGLAKGLMNVAQALVFARISSHKTQDELLEQVIESKVFKAPIEDSAASIADAANRHVLHTLRSAPFKIADEKILPKAGACTTCQQRSGSCAALFPDLDVKKDDRCLNSACWDQKTAAYTRLRLVEAKAQGYKVLEGKDAEKAHYSGNWTDLDRNVYLGDKSVTPRQLVKGADAELAILVNSRGEIEEYVSTKDFSAAVKAQTPKKEADKLTRSQMTQRDAERAERQRKVLTAAVLASLTAQAGPAALKVLGKKEETVLLTQLAELSVTRLNHDFTRGLAKALKLDVGKNKDMPGLNYAAAVRKWVETTLQTPDKGAALAVLATATVMSTGGGWSGESAFHKRLLATLRIDPKSTEAKVKADAKAEKEAKKVGRANSDRQAEGSGEK